MTEQQALGFERPAFDPLLFPADRFPLLLFFSFFADDLFFKPILVLLLLPLLFFELPFLAAEAGGAGFTGAAVADGFGVSGF